MKLTRRDLMWKWLAYGLSLALVTVINYCVLNQLPLGAIPVLLPVTAVAVGVLEGQDVNLSMSRALARLRKSSPR